MTEQINTARSGLEGLMTELDNDTWLPIIGLVVSGLVAWAQSKGIKLPNLGLQPMPAPAGPGSADIVSELQIANGHLAVIATNTGLK